MLTGITAIAGGGQHSLALKNDGTVWVWGYNGEGELGNGTNTDSNIPIQVTGLCQVLTSVNDASTTLSMTLTVFPNPFENEFTAIGTKENGVAIISDAAGKEVLRQKISSSETKIRTEKLLPGFYLLNYLEENKTANITLVKF